MIPHKDPEVYGRPNALIIHYTSNDHIIRDGEMVLMDAGCEFKCVLFIFLFHSLTPNTII